MPLYRDEAVVLRTFDLGEADRIVVLLTKNHGKVRAVAKGVRRLKSRFGGRLEPFMRVDVLLAKGKSLDVISQASSIAAYAGTICSDYNLYEYASVMLETVDALVSGEFQDSSSQYTLLISALSSLCQHKHSPKAIGMSYAMRSLCLAGWSPRLVSCVVCGREDGLQFFAPSAGGVMCNTDHTSGSYICDENTRNLLIALSNGDWKVLDSTCVDEKTVMCVERWCEYYLERSLRSFSVLS
ncbi:DNA repair protein RecO [Gardnerella sp. 2492-Sm]|uniref:DNA repair protein RecO n=1 Tax=unclassified Gardnerella TaxID=2628112 RepID=UPI003D03A524